MLEATSSISFASLVRAEAERREFSPRLADIARRSSGAASSTVAIIYPNTTNLQYANRT